MNSWKSRGEMATEGVMEGEEFVDVASCLSEENPRGGRRQPFVAVSKHSQLKHPKIGGRPGRDNLLGFL